LKGRYSMNKRKRTLRDMVPRVRRAVKKVREELRSNKKWFQSGLGTPPYSYSYSYSFVYSGDVLGTWEYAPGTARA